MDTEPLYYEDCHRKEFTARVLSCEKAEGGYAVILNRTAFYPEGGGQPCDLGILGTARVLEVSEKEGILRHLCDSPLEVGAEVQGSIDYERRFAFMQSHTGEHILSGLICRKYGCSNVGFHMGTDCMTVDFDADIPWEALLELEAEANRIIWKNLPVICSFPSAEELETLPYRSKRKLTPPVRIVTIPEADCCACCGTHVAATGEVGLIKVLSCVKFKNGVRITLVCGGQAFAVMQAVFNQNRAVSQAFSAKMLETGMAAEKMNAALEQEKFSHRQTLLRLYDKLAQEAEGKGNVLCVDTGDIRVLADRLADTCGGVAAVVSPGQKGISFCLIARSGDVSPLGRKLLSLLGGTGGGKGPMFRGSFSATLSEVKDIFVENMQFSLLSSRDF